MPIKELRSMVDAFLATCLADLTMPSRLREAMNYSLLAGGKRLRPMLCLLCVELCTRREEERAELVQKVIPFAAGLEMIHTYSLIHDDLPAMDNDDLRRGRPSCHKAFDEATAILAGDALNTDAFSFMARVGLGRKGLSTERVLSALVEVAGASGSQGMVGGQIQDMALTGATLPQDLIERQQLAVPLCNMQALKTGALFRAACVSGGILAGADETSLFALRTYALHLGVAFQIVDDILDVTQDTATLGKPAGSDAASGKITWPALFGLPHSRHLAAESVKSAVQALDIFPERKVLVDFTEQLLHRIN